MIDKTKATERARGYVAGVDPAFVVIEEETQEEPFGWVFFYKHPSETLAGNSPFVVFRHTGVIEETGTATPLEEYLAPIRAAWTQRED
jgi:hypothetical protein